MWVREFSQFYENVSAVEIWKIWRDVDNWTSWHDDLEYCKLEGEFKVGNHFMLKPKGVGAVKIVFTEVIEGRRFTDCTNFFGAKMYDTHEVKEIDGGVILSNKLVVTGPLKWLWIKFVAQNVANTIPAESDALVKLAKARASNG